MPRQPNPRTRQLGLLTACSALAAAALWASSCGPGPTQKVCVAGSTQACTGPGSCAGIQTCLADGTGYSNCLCGTGGGAGGGSTGGGAGGGSAGGGAGGGTGGGSAGGGAGGGSGGGAGGGAATCNASNCAGCCSGTACIQPTQTNVVNCGTGGQLCVTCSGNQRCISGICTTPGTGGGSGGGLGGGAGGGSGGGSAGGAGGGSGGGSAGGTGGGTAGGSGGGAAGGTGGGAAGGTGGGAAGGTGGGAAGGTGGGAAGGTGGGAAGGAGGGSAGGAGGGGGTVFYDGGIGAPCTSAANCPNVPTVAGGGPTFCKTSSLVWTEQGGQGTGYTYPGGFCTRRCTSSTQCGSNARCMYYLGFLGEAENICMPTCASTGCRPGYICVDFGNTTVIDACIVASADGGIPPLWDAGRPANDNVMGGACTTDTACQPPLMGWCISPSGLLPDGGASPYVGGSCSGDCTMSTFDDFCGPTTGACLPAAYSTAQGPLVFWSCERYCDPAATSTGCRTQYQCEQVYTSDPNYGYCFPRCTNPNFGACPTGTTCQTSSGKCL